MKVWHKPTVETLDVKKTESGTKHSNNENRGVGVKHTKGTGSYNSTDPTPEEEDSNVES